MTIDPQLVNELRNLVDAPVVECKKALVTHNGDVQAALQFLTTPHRVFRTCTPSGTACYALRAPK